VGAPIFDEAGRVQTAISVSGPVSRLPSALTLEVAEALVDAAAAISQQLGYAGHQQPSPDAQ
jgi:DNA-binding IclR family transcriptional regulator